MLIKRRFLVVIVSIFMLGEIIAQIEVDKKENQWYLSIGIGSQMSGIKDEDFILSNYSPLINTSIGKRLSQLFSVKIGYKGYYFNYIEDDYRHYYTFIYLDGVIHINNLFRLENYSKNWEVLLNIGAGYFYNFDYGRSNICADIGIQTNYRINANYAINFEIGGIIGWDIYQGNKDILPGLTLGFTYYLNRE